MTIITTKATPCTENRSTELHRVPLRVLCFSDSGMAVAPDAAEGVLDADKYEILVGFTLLRRDGF